MENKVYSIYDILIEGSWECYVYDENEEEFKKICKPFTYYDKCFWGYDGDGPWSAEVIEEISKMTDKFNTDPVFKKCFFIHK